MTTHAALRDGLASERCLELAAMSARELGAVFLRGESPDLEDLVGWEFRGLNTPSWAKLLRIEKCHAEVHAGQTTVRSRTEPAKRHG